MGILAYWGLLGLCIGVAKEAPFVPGNENEEANALSQNTPHFLSQPLELVVNEGNAVRLPCMVDTLAGFLLVWRKNGRIISIGDQIVDKSESKFHLEDGKNGNTLVIEDVDESDEAQFSCSISTGSEAELDHNVRVITRMSVHEMDHVAAENPQAAEKIENSEQGSGFVPDTNKNILQTYQKQVSKDDDEEEEEIILDTSSVGKVYFARIPSFYTFPDDGNRDVTEREQLIKHAPKSVREFLKLLRIYQSSVLTKDDIQEFNEFVFEKKPIPNTHLLRSTHAYNSNLRKSLQSANVKEIDNNKVVSEEDDWSTEDSKTEPLQRSSEREDAFESEQILRDYNDAASNLDLNQHMDTSRKSQSSPEESQEEGSFGDTEEDDNLGSGESEEEMYLSSSELDEKLYKDKPKHYSSGVRYLQGHNIGHLEEEDIDNVSEDKKFPILRGQYLPQVDIEDYDWDPENFEERARITESEDDDSFLRQIGSEDALGKESDEVKWTANEKTENYKEKAKDIESEDAFSIESQIEREDVMGKESSEIISNINEYKSKQILESYNEQEIDNTKSNQIQAENEINWYENRPEHYVIADRYLQENEIGQLEKEQEIREEDSYIPLFRGKHLRKTDLQESETEQRKDVDNYQTYLESKGLPETEESDKDMHPKHLSNEESEEIESQHEVEETPESYFPLSCCVPKTDLKVSETEQEEDVDESERYKETIPDTVIYSKQISNEERLEVVSNAKDEETPSETLDKHREESKESKDHMNKESSYEKEHDISFSPRYLNEDEIEHIEDESVPLTQKVTFPVIRGQHLPDYTLEEFNADKFDYIVEDHEMPLKSENSGENVQRHSSEKSENLQKHLKSEGYDSLETSTINQQKQSVKDSMNTLHIDKEKETLYPQEIMNIERNYFKQKPQESEEISSGYTLESYGDSSQATKEHQQKMDPNEQATINKVPFALERKIEENVVWDSSEYHDFDDDASEKRKTQDKEMVPLHVLSREESKEKVLKHTPAIRQRGLNKEKRRDGPHPFRSICMIRKCGA